VDSIAILELGPIRVHAWTLLVYAGALVGVSVSLWSGTRRGFAAKTIIEAWLCTLPAALIVGRMDSVISNLRGYRAQPELIWQTGRPMTYPGLLLGGAIGLGAYALWRKASWRTVADSMAMGVPISQAIIWVGAMFQGVAHGPVTYRGWAWELPDAYGVVLPRTPVQMLGSIAALLISALLFAVPWRKDKADGKVFATFLLADGLAQFALGFARGDAAPMIGPLRIAQLWHMASAIVACGLLLRWQGSSANPRKDQDVATDTAHA
jgi:prolipoprotein diacylglyceryltransferase